MTISFTGCVEEGEVLEENLAGRKKKMLEESRKDNKKATRSTSDDLKTLDDKWSQRFVCLEANIRAKTFAVPVEPVQKTGSEVVTSEKTFFILQPVPARTILVWLPSLQNLLLLVPVLFRPPRMVVPA